ncbi:hypothetical protein PIPA1_49980 [Pelosinus sp. IPA-1]|nr:hypothetical protein PIPA1_49980 [Pelosinus sp. IPA-1]
MLVKEKTLTLLWVFFCCQIDIVLGIAFSYFVVPEIGENASDARRDEHTN